MGTGKKTQKEKRAEKKKAVLRKEELKTRARVKASRLSTSSKAERKQAKRDGPEGPEIEEVRKKRLQEILQNLRDEAEKNPMKNLVRAKWPALFKRHLGMIEFHIQGLDRIMDSMRAEVGLMSERQRLEWALGKRGNWRVMCEMMDRARVVYIGAKVAARGILPPERLRDKVELGVKGTSYRPLGPELASRAAELNYTKRGKLGRNPDDSEEDSDGEDEKNKGAADPAANGEDFISLPDSEHANLFAKHGPVWVDLLEGLESETTEEGAGSSKGGKGSEHNSNTPLFFVDLEGGPGPEQVLETKQEKKERLKKEREARKAAKKAERRRQKQFEESQFGYIPPPPKPQPAEPVEPVAAEDSEDSSDSDSEEEVDEEMEDQMEEEPLADFSAIEAQLQAEVAAGILEQEEAAAREAQETSATEEKSTKKRRRTSDGTTELSERQLKKDRKEKEKKRKDEESDVVETSEEPEVSVQKSKKEKSKKRKAEESGDDVAAEQSELASAKAEKKARKEKDKKRKAEDDSIIDEETEERKKKRKHRSAASKEEL